MKAIRASARVRGLSCKLLRTRGEVRQRRPLPVDMEATVERILEKGAPTGDVDALVAGTTLFVLFARARVGDVRRCNLEPVLDASPDGSTGFLETRFAEHKTSRPGSRLSLPITAPAFGVTGINWGKLWIGARTAAGLDAAVDKTLLPARGDNSSWLKVAYLTPEFAATFRGVLLRAGHSPRGVGGHRRALAQGNDYARVRQIRR